MWTKGLRDEPAHCYTEVAVCVSGVKFDVDKQHRDRVHIHSIPACMAQREANDRKRGKDPLSYEYVEVRVDFVFFSRCLHFRTKGSLFDTS